MNHVQKAIKAGITHLAHKERIGLRVITTIRPPKTRRGKHVLERREEPCYFTRQEHADHQRIRVWFFKDYPANVQEAVRKHKERQGEEG